jgi:hypothetical protein
MKHIAFALIVPLVSALSGKGGRFMQLLLMLCGLLLLTGEAVAEDAKEAARVAIARSFDFEDCPAIADAMKLLDGSIDALCTNGDVPDCAARRAVPDSASRKPSGDFFAGGALFGYGSNYPDDHGMQSLGRQSREGARVQGRT